MLRTNAMMRMRCSIAAARNGKSPERALRASFCFPPFAFLIRSIKESDNEVFDATKGDLRG